MTEVVRWFDMKPLEILWDNYLSREHTLLCYGSCIALRYSILHAGRLMHFLEQPPPSWKVRIYVLELLEILPGYQRKNIHFFIYFSVFRIQKAAVELR